MQPEVVSLMQQLVTAVQSIALSVDVISMDLRALNKSVAQLVKKDVQTDMSPLALAPVCTYSQDGEASSPVLSSSTPEKLSGADGAAFYQSSDVHREEEDPPERSPQVRDILREDIKKALGMPGDSEDSKHKVKDPRSSNEPEGNYGRWEDCMETEEAVRSFEDIMGGQQESEEVLQGDREGDKDKVLNPFAEIHSQSEEGQGRKLRPKRVGSMKEDEEDLEPSPGDAYSNSNIGVQGEQGYSGHSDHPVQDNVYLNPEDGICKSEGIFKCVWCGREFGDNYKLRRHWRSHTGERPFQCYDCGKAFAHKENLIVHRRIHTGERPFVCDVCEKAFAKRDRLICHKRVHSNEKPFACEDCGKRFKDRYKLKRHEKSHL